MDSSEANRIFLLLTDYFSRHEFFKLVILYGSLASGTFNRHSDVDIAVAGERPATGAELLGYAAEISSLVNKEIDLVDLHRAEGLLLYKIMTRGKRLKLDGRLFSRFNSKALGYREDFKTLQDRHRDAQIRRFFYGF